MRVLDALARRRILPVVVIDDVAYAGRVGQALVAGGLPLVEVTLRTPAAMAVLRTFAAIPGLLVGAGTVLTTAQVDESVSAGARFVVSPGVSVAVLRRAHARGVLAVPGVATASDIMTALDEGVQTVKFFPAEASGGVPVLRSLMGPFPQVRFVPTGGIRPGTVASYLALPNVLAVGGTWLVPPAAGGVDGAALSGAISDAVALGERFTSADPFAQRG